MTTDVLAPTLVTPTHLENDKNWSGDFTWEKAWSFFNFKHGGKVNLAYEAVDRHVEMGWGDKIALRYIDQAKDFAWTYKELKIRSDYFAKMLKDKGLEKGDRVFIFLPKVPELYAAILGAIKAGAVAGPLFEAFYEDALRDRLGDCGAKFLITNSELASRVPKADLPLLKNLIVLEELFPDISKTPVSNKSQTVWLDLEDGLIIHYTSGSTGKPKGILHAHRAMIQHALTGRWVLDLKDKDVYWCTAHPGWVTGSSYGIFAPLLNRATILVNGGRFDADTWYSLIAKAGVTVWYSAPTAFRMLLAAGDEAHERHYLSSLRHILSVGEPLNPELVHWGKRAFGVRVHDTWWMTETGAQLIVNLPNAPIRPGSMGWPLPGIDAMILDSDLNEVPPGQVGQLSIKTPWPSLMKTVWNNKEKFSSYFVEVQGKGTYYLSGDSAKMDWDGSIFFQGRDDDLIVSGGEKISPFEVESTLIEHPSVSEAGVIAQPDELRGNLVKAYVVLRDAVSPSENLADDIRDFVKTKLSAHAYPREVEIVASLPKTRVSGKIMRRVLKAWDNGTDVGDTTTLDSPIRHTLAKSQIRRDK